MRNCEQCGGKKWFSALDRKTGLQRRHHIRLEDGTEYDLRIWRCWRCGNTQEDDLPFIPLEYRTAANVLYIDLEVSKSLYFSYGARVPSTYLNTDDLLHEYYIICWSASYVGSNVTWFDCVTTQEALAWDDKRILARLNELMASADIIAGHNVDRFDMKKANARFILNGYTPVTDKKTLDTLKIARSKFAFESNKLDYIAQKLGFRPKDHIDNNDWLAIVKTGDERTLKKVLKYNKKDVKIGKDVLGQLMKYSGKRSNYGARTFEFMLNHYRR